MALFGRKTKEQAETKAVSPKEAPVKEKKGIAPKLTAGRDLASVIVRPRITEKAALAIDKNMYTFEVHKNATKHDVRDAIVALYKVTPVKINIVNRSPRQYMSRLRRRRITENGLKKAYVYLKEGDRIDLV
jgi:large subunit ribosomal protein L23